MARKVLQQVWHSEEDLKDFISEFVKDLKLPLMLGLVGPLGAGKTTFVRHLAEQLGSKDLVSSPSYVLEQRYRLSLDHEISHWDLYRLKTCPDELLTEIPPNELRIIEWIDKFPELQRLADFILFIDLDDSSGELKRVVRLEAL